MRPFRAMLGVVLLCGVSIGVGFFGFNAFQHAQFARAEERIEITRQALAQVEDLATVFRHVGQVVEPSVVRLEVTRTIRAAGRRTPLEEELRRFFPEGLPEGFPDRFGTPDLQLPPMVGTGSGVIVAVENGYGYIVTNHHVVGDATEMQVELADGRMVEAELVGSDPRTDIAVVRIQADRLIPAKWGNSDELQKGDWVLAFGSPFGWVGSMTHGIVSALDRHVGIIARGHGYENFIQTDAAINPGNSGGPLANIRGEVVGINTAIATAGPRGFQGVGFAIPSNQARFVYEAIREHGRVTRGWLGIEMGDVAFPEHQEMAQRLGYDRREGVFVRQVFSSTPAHGILQPEDIVIAMDGEPVATGRQFRNRIATIPPGTEVTFTIFRDGKEQDVTVRLGEQPEDMEMIARPDAPPRETSRETTAEQLGVRLQTLTEQLAHQHGVRDAEAGAVITHIAPRSLAQQAGLRVGDVIVRVNARNITTAEEAGEALAEASLGEGIRIRVIGRTGERVVFIRAQ